MTRNTLSPEEREFCSIVSQAGTVNHFSGERLKLDRKMADLDTTAPKKTVLGKAIDRLNGFVRDLEESGRANIVAYSYNDRTLLGFTLLFAVFHQFMPDFDTHILRERDHGDSTIPVEFADKALSRLEGFGFRHEEALLYFAIFFQLRRAYFFIESQIVGISPCMVRLREELWNNVFTHDQLFYADNLIGKMEDFSTIILGPTGTGKGTAAAAIGKSGFIPFNPRKKCFEESFTRAFVAINLSEFPETLVESELFGHRKGAFTGAVEAHDGVFSRCSPHGSIFLDEIGDVPVSLQTKLLRVLQERAFVPVGSHEKRRFSGRVIAATNRDLVEMRRLGTFRNDFYYRLCSDIITMPSLQQRISEDPGELAALVGNVASRIVGKTSSELTDRLCRVIRSCMGGEYGWPGNVRELEQCVRGIIIRGTCSGDPAYPGTDSVGKCLNEIARDNLTADSLLARYCRTLYESHKAYTRVAEITGLDRRTVKKYVDSYTDDG